MLYKRPWMPLAGEGLHRWVVEKFLSRLAFDRLNTNGASVKESRISRVKRSVSAFGATFAYRAHAHRIAEGALRPRPPSH
jgi:hypothetical protein